MPDDLFYACFIALFLCVCLRGIKLIKETDFDAVFDEEIFYEEFSLSSDIDVVQILFNGKPVAQLRRKKWSINGSLHISLRFRIIVKVKDRGFPHKARIEI